jgi:hypothetical protein
MLLSATHHPPPTSSCLLYSLYPLHIISDREIPFISSALLVGAYYSYLFLFQLFSSTLLELP